MVTLWFVLLGALFAGYFALAGADYGTALLMRAVGVERRREVLAATGPFFLGNEVWLVAAVGVMFGAFPRLEGELLSALYPVLVAVLAGLVAFTAAVQLRSRLGGGRKAGWDALIVGGATVVAVGWGVFLGALLAGLPLDAAGHRTGGIFSPVVVLSALAFAALVAAHGAVFLSWRSTVDVRRLVPALTRVAAALVALVAVAAAVLVEGVQPLVALPGAGAVIALVLAGGVARRPAWAAACTAMACGLPVVVIGAARWPVALASTGDPAGALTVAESAAGPATLGLLAWFAVLVVPLVLAFQGMCWWAYRGKTPVFW